VNHSAIVFPAKNNLQIDTNYIDFNNVNRIHQTLKLSSSLKRTFIELDLLVLYKYNSINKCIRLIFIKEILKATFNIPSVILRQSVILFINDLKLIYIFVNALRVGSCILRRKHLTLFYLFAIIRTLLKFIPIIQLLIFIIYFWLILVQIVLFIYSLNISYT